MPTGCHGPLRSTIEAESWEEPGNWAKKSTVTHNVAGTPVSLTGCSKLKFPAEISVEPDSSNASTSSGLTVNVHVPQNAALNPNGLAESALRDTTVALPEGVAINPSGGDGLESCTSEPAALAAGALGSSGDQIGYMGQEELNAEYEPGVKWNTFTSEVASPLAPGFNFCPNGSKIGTVKIKTPLLEHELEGSVYLAAQDANPFGSLIAMYIVAEDPYSGSVIKLAGEVSLNPQTGQIVTTFKNTPDVPFENLELHFFGGERAPLRDTVALWDVHDEGGVHAVGRQRSRDLGIVVQHRTRPEREPVPGCDPAVRPDRERGRDQHPGGCVLAVDGDGEPQRRRTEPEVARSETTTGPVRCAVRCRTVPRTTGQRRAVRRKQQGRRSDDRCWYRQRPVYGHRREVLSHRPIQRARQLHRRRNGVRTVRPNVRGAREGRPVRPREHDEQPSPVRLRARQGQDRTGPADRGDHDHLQPTRVSGLDPDEHRRDPPGNPARQRHHHPRELPIQPNQLLKNGAHRHGAAERRRFEHDLNAVSGHQLRRAEVRTQIHGLDIRQNKPHRTGRA